MTFYLGVRLRDPQNVDVFYRLGKAEYHPTWDGRFSHHPFAMVHLSRNVPHSWEKIDAAIDLFYENRTRNQHYIRTSIQKQPFRGGYVTVYSPRPGFGRSARQLKREMRSVYRSIRRCGVPLYIPRKAR